jgi:3-methyladenine DNA glycosylase AlkD
MNVSQTLRGMKNDEIAKQSLRFFKTNKGEYGYGDKFLGIQVPILRENIKKFKDISIEDNLWLLKSEFHEERLFALLMFVYKFSTNKNLQEEIYKIYLENTKYINNWDLVDSSAYKIVGCFLFDKNRDILYKLANSTNLWERRISIVSTFYMIKRNDFEDTLKISKILLNDNEDLIHKAVGWMLREVGKRDLNIEKQFLDKYHTQMPRVMVRYAIERFEQNLRKQFLIKKGD